MGSGYLHTAEVARRSTTRADAQTPIDDQARNRLPALCRARERVVGQSDWPHDLPLLGRADELIFLAMVMLLDVTKSEVSLGAKSFADPAIALP